MIVGLSGYARSGKDEAAKVLVEQYGFTRISFADKLRGFLYALNPDVAKKRFLMPRKYIPVQEVIDQYGWDGYKETGYGKETRALLQRLGTEAGRNVLWDTIWIDAAFHDLDESGNYVVTDVRFPNEADEVRNRRGGLWRITRAGVGPANDHPSETSLDDFDFDRYISNNGSLEEYHEQVALAMENALQEVADE